MKCNQVVTPTVCLLLLLAGAMLSRAEIPWATEKFERAGRSEFYGTGQYLHSDALNFDGPTGQNVRVKMDDTGLGGLGFAYNFSDYIAIRFDLMFGSADFSGEMPVVGGGTARFTQNAFIQTGKLNLDYNIINRRISPFVTAGIGYQYLETELESLPPVNTCWWDPWWGWICDYSQPYAAETYFTWNAGAGMRWDVTDNFFIKAMGTANWVDYGGGAGVTMQVEANFSLGMTF